MCQAKMTVGRVGRVGATRGPRAFVRVATRPKSQDPKPTMPSNRALYLRNLPLSTSFFHDVTPRGPATHALTHGHARPNTTTPKPLTRGCHCRMLVRTLRTQPILPLPLFRRLTTMSTQDGTSSTPLTYALTH